MFVKEIEILKVCKINFFLSALFSFFCFLLRKTLTFSKIYRCIYIHAYIYIGKYITVKAKCVTI